MASDGVIGWDLGGAHVKAVRLGDDGRLERAVQVPCRLWLGIAELEAALAEATHAVGDAPRHALTMTGEMADCFADRADGVARILDAACARFGATNLAVFAGSAGFLQPDDARARAREVASANWLASATLLGRQVPDALLVDIGSTTCDIVPVAGGQPRARGHDDSTRLATGELVYTGAVRTPVMAVVKCVPLAGQWLPVMAEHFATMADIHRLAGGLPAEADQQPSADAGGKSLEHSARRLARMVGRDVGGASLEEWSDLACWIAERQLREVHDAASQVLSAAGLPKSAPLVAAGVGDFIVQRLASRIGRPWRDFADAVGMTGSWASACAPALAVAALLRDAS